MLWKEAPQSDGGGVRLVKRPTRQTVPAASQSLAQLVKRPHTSNCPRSYSIIGTARQSFALRQTHQPSSRKKRTDHCVAATSIASIAATSS